MTVMNSRRGPSPLVIALEQMAFFRNDARAACAESDPELWFGYGSQTEDTKTTPTAVIVCRTCPLLAGCRQWGLEHREHGIWGGLTENARNRIYRAREKAVA